MNTFPLSPFLESLAADDFQTTLDDYRRIAIVFQSKENWSINYLKNVLLALLVKNEEQKEIFNRLILPVFIQYFR